MIVALAIVAALMTLTIALSLPFFGWRAGTDAAGRGMAMFVPAIAMTVRIACLAAALIALAADEGLTWSGLPTGWAGVLAVLVLALLGAASFTTAALLVKHAPPKAPAGPAWIATVFTPLLIAGWLAVEPQGATAQAWAMRGLVGVFALAALAAPFVALRQNRRLAAEDAAARDAAERLVAARVDALPADADLRAMLAFLEALPEDDRQAREQVKSRATMLPDRAAQTMAMLADPDRAVRLRAARFAMHISMPETPAYYAIAEREIAEIIRRLEQRAGEDAELYLEGRAAIGLAWPAMHRTHLARAQMAALHAALIAQGEASACRALTYDAGLLKDYVAG